MCMNDACPMAKDCYRHEAIPGKGFGCMGLQAYASFAPDENGNCKHFYPIEPGHQLLSSRKQTE